MQNNELKAGTEADKRTTADNGTSASLVQNGVLGDVRAKEEEFNQLKDFLNGLDFFPDENEIEDIISLAIKQDGFESNKGYKFERTKYNPRENAFYLQWMKENKPNPGINFGQGILQDLFIEQSKDFPLTRKYVEIITNRDRYIAATVIQWLGTNCGMAFLNDALKRFGARIEEVR
jgi:hypothetical protein